MNPLVILNVAAVTISVVALVVSGLLARQQATMMRHGNELAILIDLVKEFRSKDFQAAEYFVLNKLAAENDPSLGLIKLPEAAPRAAQLATRRSLPPETQDRSPKEDSDRESAEWFTFPGFYSIR